MTNSNDSERNTEKARNRHRAGAAITLGAIAAGAAAAGYYFYGHKDAKEHRKQAAVWSRSFKKEVARQLQRAEYIDRESVAAAVDKAVGIYERLRAIDSAELMRAARELKSHWQQISDEFQNKRTHSRTQRAKKAGAAAKKRSPKK